MISAPPRPVTHFAQSMITQYQAEARRRWPHATIQGTGPFAVVVSCYPSSGVWLFPTRLEAKSLAAKMDAEGCGHAFCTKRHLQTHLDISVPDVVEELGYE